MENSVRENFNIFFLFVLVGCSVDTDGDDRNHTDNTGTYKLVWSDEFDQDGVPDPEKWTYERGFVRNQELQWYRQENAFCENGLLVIEGRRESVPIPDFDAGSADWKENRETATYTSASVTTRGLHTWKYGRFEIKARIRAEPGLWPAIWTKGADQPWPEGGEIDIMEYYDHSILANAAWAGAQKRKAIWDSSKRPMSHFNDPNWSDKFHVWRMDWTEERISIYLDGELLNTIDLSKTINKRGIVGNPFNIPHFLILNLAVGGSAGGDPSDTPFPSRYEIDYVRIYQRL